MEKIMLFFAGIISLFVLRKSLFQKLTVFEYERGLTYVRGRFIKILPPGQYWILAFNTRVTKIDIRPKFVTIPGQEILSADNVSLKVSLAAQYEVIDPNIAVNNVENYQEAIYTILQLGLREIVGAVKIDEFLADRGAHVKKLYEITVSKVQSLGLKLISVDIKDIMFPGELKKVFAQVVQAQKEGLAVLEKARGETAALRHLANAAKMIEDNPALMQLRVLQSSGNTIVLGMPTANILPVKDKTGSQEGNKNA